MFGRLSKVLSKAKGVGANIQLGASRRSAMTQALVLEEKHKLGIRDIDINEPFTADDVRIDIHKVGICGSDVHYYQHGSIGPFVLNQPMVLGHEGSGVVTEVGKNVKNLKVGDRVCMEPGVPGPNSRATQIGLYNLDPQLRFWATPPPPYATDLHDDPAWCAGHGCLRPSVVHPASFTFKLPDNVSLEEGAMVEPLAVGMQAATKAQIKPGDNAIVIGAGPIGNLTALAALAGGCAKVWIADVVGAKLAVAESLVDGGKIVGVDVTKQDLASTVMDATDGWGADLVFECSGNARAASGAVNMLRPGGGMVLVGCGPEPLPLDIATLQVKELRVTGIFRYANVYPQAINLMGTGSIDVKPIITDHFSFVDSVKGFDYMCNPGDTTVKSVITLKEE